MGFKLLMHLVSQNQEMSHKNNRNIITRCKNE